MFAPKIDFTPITPSTPTNEEIAAILDEKNDKDPTRTYFDGIIELIETKVGKIGEDERNNLRTYIIKYAKLPDPGKNINDKISDIAKVLLAFSEESKEYFLEMIKAPIPSPTLEPEASSPASHSASAGHSPS